MGVQSQIKSVLITGCSPGSIGEALAKEFLLQPDFAVCATSLPGEELPELEVLGATCYPVDVTSSESVKALKDAVVDNLGDDLDILINCAGMNYVMPALDVDVDELKRIFDVNLFGLVRTVQAFSTPLINRKGLIVNVGSLAAYAPYVFGSSYNASKAALLAYGNTLRIELSPWSVRVMTIVAGPVVSGLMTRKERRLPQDSRYQPIAEAFDQRTTHDKHGVQAMATKEFAQSVVKQALKSNPPRSYWIGPFANMVWWLETLGLASVWSWFFRKRFQLWKLDQK
ncbi:Uu.00g143130.m01.CDS01 [Anthostomella pinea]|uniref:Uu.00g143130.m01.CDS01 n=1 Tax=Anthostomella pinea TaxID=933095 RepID=A0AAI8YLL6_9PEZI|nr:Uu.00g143130.m01.CDS01 [Anthostomella pinea]